MIPRVASAPPIAEVVKRKVGPERASLTASPLDYVALPLLGPPTQCMWDDRAKPGDPCAPFAISKTVIEATCAPPKKPRSRSGWTFGDTSTATAVLRTGPDGVAQWTPITRPTGTDALFVTQYAGTWDGRGLARARRKVAAKAIVPHQVYVFRTCESACDAAFGDPARTERITVLGPPSVWVGSSGDPRDAALSGEEPFTLLSAIARPGEATSLTIAYTSVAGSRFQGAEDVSSVATNVQTVTLEVVWDLSSGPAATVYRGTIPEGAASNVGVPPAPPPDCE